MHLTPRQGNPRCASASQPSQWPWSSAQAPPGPAASCHGQGLESGQKSGDPLIRFDQCGAYLWCSRPETGSVSCESTRPNVDLAHLQVCKISARQILPTRSLLELAVPARVTLPQHFGRLWRVGNAQVMAQVPMLSNSPAGLPRPTPLIHQRPEWSRGIS